MPSIDCLRTKAMQATARATPVQAAEQRELVLANHTARRNAAANRFEFIKGDAVQTSPTLQTVSPVCLAGKSGRSREGLAGNKKEIEKMRSTRIRMIHAYLQCAI